MIFLIIWLIGLVLAVLHYLIRRSKLTKKQTVELFILYLILFGYGGMGIFGAMGHILNPVGVAKGIGWEPSPLFQFELGAVELGWALTALIALWVRNKYYWLGMAIAPAVMLILAAAQHLVEAYGKGNFAPYNFIIILPDILIPLSVLGLLAYYFQITKNEAAE
jgi:hypothetical protein